MEAIYVLPQTSQKFLVLILPTLEGWKADSTLEHPVVLNTEPLDWESSPLTIQAIAPILPRVSEVMLESAKN